MGIKTRSNYGTGAKECSPKCKCFLCNRKWIENKPKENRDFITEYFMMHKGEK